MERAAYFHNLFREHFPYVPTSDQDELFRVLAGFITGDDADILVVNGYAGTGKTSAISAVIAALDVLRPVPDPQKPGQREEICFLMAPTGRAAKVLSSYSGKPARTIHKSIYRQKSVGDDGFGQFSMISNKMSHKLFIVDEASLIGIDDTRGQGSASFGTGDLLRDLVTFVRNGNDCRLILIGDSAQLPPVGMEVSPALNSEYMDSFGGVVWCTLSEVVRQQQESGILYNATRLRELIS